MMQSSCFEGVHNFLSIEELVTEAFAWTSCHEVIQYSYKIYVCLRPFESLAGKSYNLPVSGFLLQFQSVEILGCEDVLVSC